MIKADELVVANVQSNPFKMPRALVKLDLLAFKNFLPNREMHTEFLAPIIYPAAQYIHVFLIHVILK